MARVLGLAVAQAIVRAHDRSMHAQARDGAVLRIEVPRD